VLDEVRNGIANVHLEALSVQEEHRLEKEVDFSETHAHSRSPEEFRFGQKSQA
tara:strand:+ start:66 stop:224 length:159 start_codon:yes stop_codon:yes gene_type:complete